MTTRKYSSRSQQSTLTGAITSGATSMTVVSGTALLGGVTIPAGTTFTLVIDVDTALEEIVDATAVSTNTFTITRAIDGSSAQDHSAGAVVRHMAIGRDYRDSNLHAEASAYYNDGSGSGHTMHGIGSGEGDVVGTLKTQTLTNKTLTAPTISDPTITGTASAGAVLVFEGATVDAYETTLTVVDPTQDNTVTIPNTTGTVVLDSATQTLTNKTLTSPTISGSPVITGLSSVGMVTTSATPKSYVDSILGSATAAATSAASAAASATAAATSATSAAASASAAATSATSASASATAAATSATSAAASATAAATSATSSAASATTAQAWAIQLSTPVSGSDYSAKYNANLAATSATSAATSATSAANSATAATTSATSAAASATAAATSATSAAASATAAATSATSAALSYTTFNDQYLGAKSSAPTLNNSGGALVSGNLYFNTSDSTLYVYNVSTWQAAAVSTAGFATLGTNTFTGSQTAPSFIPNSSTSPANGMYLPAANTLGFATNSTRAVTIDSTGKVGIGTTSPAQILSIYSATGATIISEGDATTFNILSRSSTDTTSAALVFRKARGTSASRTVVSSGDFLGNIIFAGYDGASNIIAGSITSAADAAPSTGIIPGRLMFNTADSAGTLTERMRINSSGSVSIGSTSGTLGSGSVAQQFGVVSTAASNVATVIRGAASQTGNLTEWQNSAGTVLAAINSSGQIGLGTSTGLVGKLLAVGDSTSSATLVSYRVGSNAGAFAARNSNGTIASPTANANGDQLGLMIFQGYDGTTFNTGAGIYAYADNTVSTGVVPGRLQFLTTDSSGVFNERMRIDSKGNTFIGAPLTAGQNTGGLTIQGKDIELMTLMGAY